MSGILQTVEGQNHQLVLQAAEMLFNAQIRDFHITVESDSLAQIDDQEEKAAATEAVKAVSDFMGVWLPVVAQVPQMIPMVSEMLLFLVRRYRAGRQLEAVIEESMKQLKAAAEAPKGPSPEQVEAQMQQQADQMRIQADTQAAQMKEQFAAVREKEKLQSEGQLEQSKMQMEQQRLAFEAQIEAAAEAKKADLEWRQSALDAETKLRIAEMDNQTKLEIARASAESAANQAQVAADTSLKTTEMTNATKLATMKPPEDPKAKAEAEMPANQLESNTNIRIAELEKEATTGSAALSAAGDIGSAKETAKTPKESPKAAEPAAEKKPTKWKIVRDDAGRMSELVAG
jgi:hypothetical protein